MTPLLAAVLNRILALAGMRIARTHAGHWYLDAGGNVRCLRLPPGLAVLRMRAGREKSETAKQRSVVAKGVSR